MKLGYWLVPLALLALVGCGGPRTLTVIITAPEAGATVTEAGPLAVTGQVMGAAREASYSLNGGAAVPLPLARGTFAFEVALVPGANTVVVRASGAGGEASAQVTVDYDPPFGSAPPLLDDDALVAAPLYRQASRAGLRAAALLSPTEAVFGASLPTESAPDISPSEGYLTYVQEQDDAFRIVLVEASTLRRILVFAGASDVDSVAVSQDGNLLAFSARRGASQEIFLFDRLGTVLGEPRLVRLTDTAADERGVSMALRIGSDGTLHNTLVLAWQTVIAPEGRPFTTFVIAKVDLARRQVTLEPAYFDDQDFNITEPTVSGNGGVVAAVLPPGVAGPGGALLACATPSDQCSVAYQAEGDITLASPSLNADGTAALVLERSAAGDALVYVSPQGGVRRVLGTGLGLAHPALTADGTHVTFDALGEVFAQPLGDVLATPYALPSGLVRVSRDDGFADRNLRWARGSGGASATTLLPPPDEARFNILLRFVGDAWTPAQRTLLQQAAARWQEIITHDLESFAVDLGAADTTEGAPGMRGVIDDLVVDAVAQAMDGAGGMLARAGPRIVRADGRSAGLPLYGVMAFDRDDLLPGGALSDAAALYGTALHELGHVLGIGALWEAFEVVFGTGGLPGDPAYDPRYTGMGAVTEWRTLGGMRDVPLENTGGLGSRDGHWRELTFGDELMTPFAGNDEPLSRLTAASLADLGYTVALANADTFALPVLRQLEPRTTSYEVGADFVVAPGSGQARVSAPAAAVGVVLTGDRNNSSGCAAADFAGFPSGNIALLQRGGCTFAQKLGHAAAAGAAAVIFFNQGDTTERSVLLADIDIGSKPATLPVLGVGFGLGATLAAASDLRLLLDTSRPTRLAPQGAPLPIQLVEEVLRPTHQLGSSGVLRPLFP